MRCAADWAPREETQTETRAREDLGECSWEEGGHTCWGTEGLSLGWRRSWTGLCLWEALTLRGPFGVVHVAPTHIPTSLWTWMSRWGAWPRARWLPQSRLTTRGSPPDLETPSSWGIGSSILKGPSGQHSSHRKAAPGHSDFPCCGKAPLLLKGSPSGPSFLTYLHLAPGSKSPDPNLNTPASPGTWNSASTPKEAAMGAKELPYSV